MKEKYQMRSKTLIIIALLLVLLQIGICTWLYNYTPPLIIDSDTVVQVQFDTIETIKDTTITKFVPKTVVKIKTDTITKDTILNTERKTYIDTLCNEGDTIQLTTTISGCKASLDSISAKWSKHHITKTEYITVTKYIEKPKTFKDHFSLGVGMGYGYGLNNKQFEPFIGVSFNYNLDF